MLTYDAPQTADNNKIKLLSKKLLLLVEIRIAIQGIDSH
jgi:hypothetical protein